MDADRLMDHFETPYHRGSFLQATHNAEVCNPACGDSVTLQISVKASMIDEAWFQARACFVCAGAASILCQLAEGQRAEQIAHLSGEEFLKEIGFSLTPRRQQCALLPLQALKTILYNLGDD